MAIFKALLTSFLLAASLTNALPSGVESSHLEARAPEIGHKEVVPFKGSVPNNLGGDLHKKYKPFLKVNHGCVPFPAVDKQGRVSGGLAKGGTHSGKCSKSTGQVYSRAKTTKDGRYAIMYSWYFPKDAGAHRHDWEGIVVWLTGRSKNAKVVGVAFSAHGKYRKYKKGHIDLQFADSSHVKVQYGIDDFSHAVNPTFQKGGQQPLIEWSKLGSKAQKALESHNWEAANVPFINKNFDKELQKAKL